MARYIDADALKSVINGIDTSKPYYDKDDIIEQVIGIIDHVPTVDVVHRVLYDQTAWERDVALTQLADIGKGLGEKMDDVQKVVHGHWIYAKEQFQLCNGKCKSFDNYYCSVCDEVNDKKAKCCPNCGAKMDEEYRNV